MLCSENKEGLSQGLSQTHWKLRWSLKRSVCSLPPPCQLCASPHLSHGERRRNGQNYLKVCMLSHFNRVRLMRSFGLSLPGSSVHGDSPGKNTGKGCHALLQGNLPNPGIDPTSLTTPALAGGFFTTSTTWEAQTS